MPANDTTDEQKSGIRLVRTATAPRPEMHRVNLGNYFADIVVSQRETNCCYYVLQRIGSAEILDMQRYDTPEAAEAAAYSALKTWNGQDLLHQFAR